LQRPEGTPAGSLRVRFALQDSRRRASLSGWSRLRPGEYVLEPEARRALGKVSPELAWERVRAQVASAVELYYQAAAELLKVENYPDEGTAMFPDERL
jgi:hypothetical protein